MVKVKIVFGNGRTRTETFSRVHKAGDYFFDSKSRSKYRIGMFPISVYQIVSIDRIRVNGRLQRVERVKRHPEEEKIIKRLKRHPWLRGT